MRKLAKGADTQESIEARIGEMERKLDRLRGLYESFFMGIERAPPNVARRDMNRLILEMQQEPIGNASLRFRFQSMIQRWVLMTAYWNRTLREIESGTYRRDVARAQRHLAEKGRALTEQEAIAIGIPAGRAKAFVERQQKMQTFREGRAAAKGSSPGMPAAPRPAVEAIPGVDDGAIEAVYRRYTEAHRQAQDPRPALTLDKIRERLRLQIPRVLAEKNCRRVSLDVAIEDGKVRLKAWPVKE
ncbi:MAG TPA: MXAN_5187 C-terminal domain-containing protein [Polyangia bacterium]|nr:MXAN_5187 C-terminal domain-containing protein [Polyangia bacterium]